MASDDNVEYFEEFVDGRRIRRMVNNTGRELSIGDAVSNISSMEGDEVNRRMIERIMGDVLRTDIASTMDESNTSIQNNRDRFLHNHPGMEERLGLNSNHVIVDRDEWETVISNTQDVYSHIDTVRALRNISLESSPNKKESKMYEEWCKSKNISNVLKLGNINGGVI